MKRSGKQKSWIYAIIMVLVFTAAGALMTEMRYSTVDDAPTVRMFMGYEGGTPGDFHLFFHTVLVRIFQGLSNLLPGIAWVTIIQLACIWFSNVVIVKNLLEGVRKSGQHTWLGIAVSIGYLGAFLFYFTACPTYTTTVSLLGAAAVAQGMGVDWEEPAKDSFRSLFLSVVLLWMGYLWREIGAWPCLAFWLLGLFWTGLKHPLQCSWQKAKPLFMGVVCCAAGLVLFMGAHALEVKLMNAEEFYRWHAARTALFDFSDFEQAQQMDTIEETGWTNAKIRLVEKWYFMDEDITAEALEAQAAAQTQSSVQGSSIWEQALEGLKAMNRYWRSEPIWFFVFCAMLLIMLCGLILTLLQRPVKLWQWAAMPSGAALGGVLLLYLCWNGRLLLRSYASVLLPMSAYMLMSLFVLRKAEKHRGEGVLMPVFALAFLIACVPCGAVHYRGLVDSEIVAYCRKHLEIGNSMD